MVILQMQEEMHDGSGEWGPPPPMHHHPVTPPRLGALKRSGDDLVSDRDAPSMRSPAHSHHGSPMLSHNQAGHWGGPVVQPQLLSPRPEQHHRSTTPEHHDHLPHHGQPHHPELLHTPSAGAYGGPYVSYENGEGDAQSTLRSPAVSHHGSPMVNSGGGPWIAPSVSAHLLSPRPAPSRRSVTPNSDEKSTSANLRHPPIDASSATATQPELLRTSQIPSGPTTSAYGTYATYSNKATLKLGSDLNQMAMGWSTEEWTNRRRLIQFYRVQEGNVINATFRPIGQHEFVPSSIVISCIFRDEWNECFVTSVDTIYLLEALVGVRFSVEEKNRIRRNLEGFKPMTVSKSKSESEPFFKLIMGFPNPKPRNIEKDVKVFPWKVLSSALKKIISKYSATYSAPVDGAPSVHIGGPDDGSLDHADPRMSGASAEASTSYAHTAPPASPHLTHPPSSHVYAHSQPTTPHLGGPSLQGGDPFSASPNIGGPPPAERYLSQPPLSPAQSHRLQHAPSHSHPPSPNLGDRFATQHPHSSPVALQQERYTPPHAHRSSPVMPQGGPVGSSSLDYGSLIDQSQFSPSTSRDRRGVNVDDGGFAQGPPEGYPQQGGGGNQIFPVAEDYGVIGPGGDRLVPPAMNHSRSYSEQPRRNHHPQQQPQHHPSQQHPGAYGAAPYQAEYVPQAGQGYSAGGAAEWDGPERRSSAEGWKTHAAFGYNERRPASTDGHLVHLPPAQQGERGWDRGYGQER